MKKKKILVLFPVLGLLLSGCTFQEGLANAKSWVSQHIYHPIKDWISGGGNKEEPSDGGGDTEVTISSIGIASYKEEVVLNYEYKTSDVKIRVYYSNGDDEEKAPESVACDTSKEGDTTLTVTYKGFTKTATVKVLSESDVVHVEGISVDSLYVNLHVGDTHQIVVTVTPEEATDPSCSFKSLNEDLASVSAEGLVTAKAAGVAKVEVVSNENENIKKTVQFTITEVAAGLPASTKAGYTKLAASETLKNGEKINVAGAVGEKYYVMPAYTEGNNIKGKEVSLEGEALDIAAADEFTVVVNADSTISLMQGEGNNVKYLSAAGGSSSNYLKVVSSIDDTAKFSVSVDAEGNAQLRAEAVDRGYLCLNPYKNNEGQLIPLFACYGKAQYEKYAIYHDGKGSSEHVAVESIAFDKDEYSVEAGSGVNLVVNITPALATDKQIEYSVQSETVEGCVSLNGNVVTGVKEGSAVILAKSHDNPELTDTVTVTVTPYVERNYGSLESPLTIVQAKQVIDLDNGKAAQTMYVKGKVSKNDAYSSSYKNTNVWLTDGVNEFELYGALMPEGFTPAQPAANDPALVGKTVVAHGTGKIYGTTYEFDKNCQIDSVTEEALPVISIDSLIADSATGIPETIEQGKTLSVGNISVGVNLSDGSEGTTHPDSIELSTENTGVVQGKLIISTGTTGGKTLEYAFTITVIEPVVRNYGTLENPLTVSEAFTLIEETCPNNGDSTEEQIYCEGSVTAIGDEQTYGFQNVKVSDGVKELLIYSLNMSPEQKADFAVGRTIKFHGYAKNYSGTLEFATKKIDNVNNYVTLDSVAAVIVDVTSITLDRNELNMEVGLPDETLVATVAPENASNKNVSWESSEPEVATVTDGVVHAVAAGDAVITVKSAADSSKTATCNVHVTAAQKQLDGISIKTNPKVEYTEGELLDLSDMVVTLHYDDQSTVDITSGWTTNIAADHQLTSEDTSLVVSYGGFSADAIELSIAEKQVIVQPGTYVISAVAGETTYYLKSNGTTSLPSPVTSQDEATQFDFELVENENNQYYIKSGNSYLYTTAANNGLRVGDTQAVWTISEGSIENSPGFDICTTVAKDQGTETRYISLYNTQDFRTYTSPTATNRKSNTALSVAVTSTLESISVTANPTKTSYLVGETFDPAGLEVTAHYDLSDNTSKDVVLTADQYELSFSGAFAAGDVGEKAITISFGGKETSFNVSVAEPTATLTSVTIEGTPKTNYEVGDPYSYEGLTATAHYSDESIVDVTGSADWAINKTTAVKNDESITISASYGGETGELVVNVSVAEAPSEITKTYDFTAIDFSNWTNSYSEHVVEYTECTVKFEGASKQTSTISNMPVVKNKYVEVVAKESKTISAVSFSFQQWNTKTQTMTLYYSTDGGTNYTSLEISVSDFSDLASSSLPAGTNAVKIVGSSTNQIGIAGATITFK